MINKVLKTGVFKTSNKENEKRLPIYPDDLIHIEKEIISFMYFEENYGLEFGITDNDIKIIGGNILSRDELFKQCEILILPKPTIEDFNLMKENQIVCGWVHAVQQYDIAQIAIDKKLTLIAWENMNHWDNNENKLLHIFYRNNELAGYTAVQHFLNLKGIDGFYGPRRHISILGFGSVSRGAIYALNSRGFNNIHVYTSRPTHLIANKNPDVWYHCLENVNNFKELQQSDVIVNGVLQDVTNPLTFIKNESELSSLKPFTSIIDISCDEGLGFYFAKPTSFNSPTFTIGNNITYYSVDHTPSYLWNAASREISHALLPYIKDIAQGEVSWAKNKTINKAIDIKNGIVLNQNINSFQKR